MKETTVRIHMNNGIVVIKHNARVWEVIKYEKHIAKDFGVHEVWLDGTLVKTYTDLFKSSIDDYDSKQKRKDRKIGGVSEYIASVENNKQGRKQRKTVNGKKVVVDGTERQGKRVCSELIIGCGNTNMMKDEEGHFVYRDDLHEFHHMRLPYEVSYNATKRYCDGWQARNETENGGMRVIRIDFHADEFYRNIVTNLVEMSTEHAHLAFVPWARGFKRGMDTQNSMNKALEKLGFVDGTVTYENGNEKWVCAYDKWLSKEREIYEAILQEEYTKYCNKNAEYAKENGELKIVHPYRDKNAENMLTKLYRELQDGKKALDNVNVQTELAKADLTHTKSVTASFDSYLKGKKEEVADLEEREAKVITDAEANKRYAQSNKQTAEQLIAERVSLNKAKLEMEEQQQKTQALADDTLKQYNLAHTERVEAKKAKKAAEDAKKENEALKAENEALKAKLQEQYNNLVEYVQTIQQSVKDKQEELAKSLDYIAYGDNTEEKPESDVEAEARKLRMHTEVIYNGKRYNVEAIVQGSMQEAERIVKAKREAKKNDLQARVNKFIEDTEEMLKGYDNTGTEGITK